MEKSDRSLVEHLGSRVMGWKLETNKYGDMVAILQDGESRRLMDGMTDYWDFTLDSWADAGMVWERIQTNAEVLEAIVAHYEAEYNEPLFDFLRFASPRALMLAVARATGWKGERAS